MTTNVDLTWQLSSTGFILNDDPTGYGDPFVDVTNVAGFDSAPARATKRDHEGVDGGFMDAEFETGRDIAITGTLFTNGANVMSTLDALKANWAPSPTLQQLYFMTSDVGLRYLNVKPLGVAYNLDTALRVGVCDVVFTCYAEDPRFYDNFTNSYTLQIGATIFTGFAFPFGFPLSFGGVSTTNDGVFVPNGGNRPAPVTMTINGPVTNPTIINDTTGDTMSFSATIASGQSLVINSYYKTVTLNGANRRTWMQQNGWFDLQPGSNFIRFRATGGSGNLVLQYNNAWR